LERVGYELVGVTDPEQVLPAVQDAPPDLVLLDLRLPGTDGFEVFEQLRAVSAAPVLFLSAGAQESDKERALSMGARDYLVKPVLPEVLLERIAEALSGSYAEQSTGPTA
jgi:DNA-binding response OmpR family regulator